METKTRDDKCKMQVQGPGPEPKCGAGRSPRLHHVIRQLFRHRGSTRPACSGPGQIHALSRPPHEARAHTSSRSLSLAIFCQTSLSVVTPSFQKATTSTSPRCGRWWWRPFLRGILNRVSVRGWSRIYGLRKLSAIQTYRIGRCQVLSRCR